MIILNSRERVNEEESESRSITGRQSLIIHCRLARPQMPPETHHVG